MWKYKRNRSRGSKWARNREKAFRITGSSGQEPSQLQVCMGTLENKCRHTHSTTHWIRHKWRITDSFVCRKTSGASSRPLLHIVADLITPKPSPTDGWLISALNISSAGTSTACLGSLLCHQTAPRVIKFSLIFFNLLFPTAPQDHYVLGLFVPTTEKNESPSSQ